MSEVRRFVVTGADDPAAVVDELVRRADLTLVGQVLVRRTFLDTADGRLDAAGTVLEVRRPADGRGPATLIWSGRAGGEVLASHELPATSAPPRFAADLPPGPAMGRLADLLEMRALLPQGEVDSAIDSFAVVDDERKTTARVVIDRSSVGDQPLPASVEIVPVRGYDQASRRLRSMLSSQVVLSPTDEVVATWARRAVTDQPWLSSKLRLSLDPGASAAEAWRAVLRRLTDTMADNLDGTIADTDSEFLHDYRVAIRRTRSVLGEGRKVLPPEARTRFREDFRWLGAVTTPTRDADVHLLDLPGLAAGLPGDRAEALGPLRDLLVERQRAAHEQLVADLTSPRHADVVAAWEALLADPDAWPGTDAEPDPERPDATRLAAAVAAERIARARRRLLRDGRLVEPSSPPEALHDLRKDAKRLRYLLESFGSLLPDDDVAAAVKALKALQDVLGEYQDTEVQAVELARAADDLVAGGTAPAATLLAMGALVEHLHARGQQARERFADRFARFDSREVAAVFRRLATTSEGAP